MAKVRKLKIYLGELIMAFDHSSYEAAYYLDTLDSTYVTEGAMQSIAANRV